MVFDFGAAKCQKRSKKIFFKFQNFSKQKFKFCVQVSVLESLKTFVQTTYVKMNLESLVSDNGILWFWDSSPWLQI